VQKATLSTGEAVVAAKLAKEAVKHGRTAKIAKQAAKNIRGAYNVIRASRAVTTVAKHPAAAAGIAAAAQGAVANHYDLDKNPVVRVAHPSMVMCALPFTMYEQIRGRKVSADLRTGFGRLTSGIRKFFG